MTATARSGTRLFANLAIMAFAAAALALSMSDRMPMIWRSVLLRSLNLGRSIEYRLAIDPFDHADIALPTDQLGHLILWGSGMFAIGLLTRNRFQASFVAVTLFGASMALEVGQSLWTATRSMSIGDLLANATGIMAGLSALVVIEVVIRVFASAQPAKLSTERGS